MNISNNSDDIRFQEAVKRVKKIKGFYTHAIVYVVINLVFVIINIQNLKSGESYFKFENFVTAIFWGIGLIVHALSVFVPTMIMGRNWEERKIRQIMEQEKNTKWE